ncbi:MAG: hypothetical protein AAF585_03900 [Verrucomicrobiota bacterium]
MSDARNSQAEPELTDLDQNIRKLAARGMNVAAAAGLTEFEFAFVNLGDESIAVRLMQDGETDEFLVSGVNATGEASAGSLIASLY